MKRNQSGFTLIEIAIVLVIIGLLLGGVLKGQELINSARVKNLAGDFKNIPIFIYGYQDKFKALPGDDALVSTHVSGTRAASPATCNNGAAAAASPVFCTGNGTIDGVWNSTTITDETQLFWQHARLGGFATGDTTGTDYRPTNSLGGFIGIQSNSAFTTITEKSGGAPALMSGSYIVCSTGIDGKYVKQLDTTMDNGDTDTGAMRAANPTTAGESMATTAIADGTTYTVCMGI